MTAPKSITATRSARPMTNSMSCSTSRSPSPSARSCAAAARPAPASRGGAGRPPARRAAAAAGSAASARAISTSRCWPSGRRRPASCRCPEPSPTRSSWRRASREQAPPPRRGRAASSRPATPRRPRRCAPSATFSSTHPLPSSRTCWKVRPSPSAATAARAARVTAAARKRTSPEVGSVTPETHVEERALAGAVRADERERSRPPLTVSDIDWLAGEPAEPLGDLARLEQQEPAGRGGAAGSAARAGGARSGRRRGRGPARRASTGQRPPGQAVQHHHHEQAEDDQLEVAAWSRAGAAGGPAATA